MTKLSLGKWVFSISFDVYKYYAAKQSLAFHLSTYFWMLKQADPIFVLRIFCQRHNFDVRILWVCWCILGAPPGVLGIWGEGLFIFRELGSTANYFRGAWEQALTFGDLGSTAKKLKKINIRLPF